MLHEFNSSCFINTSDPTSIYWNFNFQTHDPFHQLCHFSGISSCFVVGSCNGTFGKFDFVEVEMGWRLLPRYEYEGVIKREDSLFSRTKRRRCRGIRTWMSYLMCKRVKTNSVLAIDGGPTSMTLNSSAFRVSWDVLPVKLTRKFLTQKQ